MAAKKFYGVKKGKQTGIFKSWDACKQSVDGFPGAEYKGFATYEEVCAYLGMEPGAVSGRECVSAQDRMSSQDMVAMQDRMSSQDATASQGMRPSQNTAGEPMVQHTMVRADEHSKLLTYVDGSYDDSIKKYAFGCVFILPDGRIYTEYGNGDNPQSLQHRNVTGEMLGAMYAVRTAMMNGYRAVEICYDYEGIEKWVTGAWRSKTELTQKYAASMREWSHSIQITFTKVAAHTNVKYNEMADQLAKKGLVEGQGVPKVRRLEEMHLLDA